MEKYDCSWKNQIDANLNYWFVKYKFDVACGCYQDFYEFLEYVAGIIDITDDGKRHIKGEFTWKNKRRKCNVEVEFNFHLLSNNAHFKVLNHSEVWGENTSENQE